MRLCQNSLNVGTCLWHVYPNRWFSGLTSQSDVPTSLNSRNLTHPRHFYFARKGHSYFAQRGQSRVPEWVNHARLFQSSRTMIFFISGSTATAPRLKTSTSPTRTTKSARRPTAKLNGGYVRAKHTRLSSAKCGSARPIYQESVVGLKIPNDDVEVRHYTLQRICSATATKTLQGICSAVAPFLLPNTNRLNI